MHTLLGWLMGNPLRIALAVAMLIFMHTPAMLIFGGGLLLLSFLSRGHPALVLPIGLSVALVWLMEITLRERLPLTLGNGVTGMQPPWEWTIALSLFCAALLIRTRWGIVLGTQWLLIGAGYLLLRALAPEALQLGAEHTAEMLQQIGLTDSVTPIAPSLIAAMLASLTGLSAMLCLIIGRYWQSLLFNPGGFGEEFQRLRLPLWLLLPLCLLFFITTRQLHYDWLLLLLPTLWIAGTALAHGMVAAGRLSRAWLVLHYVLMLLSPIPMILALALDGALDFRQRLDQRWRAVNSDAEVSPSSKLDHRPDTEI